MALEAQRVAQLLVAAPAESLDPLAPPAMLNDPTAAPALVVWRDLAPTLSVTGRLGKLDRLMFAGFCYWAALFAKASDDLARNGRSRLVRTVSGDKMPRRNPAVDDQREAWSRMVEMSAKFGLTPMDRAAVAKAAKGLDLDDDDELPFGGQRKPVEPAASGVVADGWADLIGPAPGAEAKAN